MKFGIVVIISGIAILMQRGIKKLQKKRKYTTLRQTFIYDCLYVAIAAVAFFLILAQLPGVESASEKIFAGSGIAAIVIGLAAQSSLGNIFCGFLLLVSKPFEIGDRVEIAGDVGTVTALTLQYTVVTTYLNEELMIPNALVSQSRIKNYSKITGSSYPIEISVAYGTDLNMAKRLISEVICNNQSTIGKILPENVLVKEAGDFGITLKAVVTTAKPEDNPSACSECLQMIIQSFTEQGINIPYPTYTILQDS